LEDFSFKIQAGPKAVPSHRFPDSRMKGGALGTGIWPLATPI
jgi:hypothetical protein